MVQLDELLSDGELAPSFLITHTFGLPDFRLALETLRNPPPGEARRKVMVVLRD
jgi:threonine dehydrogenase-like Zn-dependent dehydrogenase